MEFENLPSISLLLCRQGEGDYNAKLGITILGIYTHTHTSRTFTFLERLMFIIQQFCKHRASEFSGESVAVEDEVVVINSIVLPNKTLSVSVQEEIIL